MSSCAKRTQGSYFDEKPRQKDLSSKKLCNRTPGAEAGKVTKCHPESIHIRKLCSLVVSAEVVPQYTPYHSQVLDACSNGGHENQTVSNKDSIGSRN